jgi:3-oxoacyl-[acyl-carrier-protein] synthase-1
MARELDYFSIVNEEGHDENVIGHPIAGAAGFRGLGKLLCLAWPALDELLQTDDVRAMSRERTGLFLCLPSPGARGLTTATASSQSSLGPELCQRLLALADMPLLESNCASIEADQAGFAAAVSQVAKSLRTGRLHRCLVGGIDSLLTEEALEALASAGRLKTSTKPDGLQPGEAASFVLLERFDAAQARQANVLAAVTGVSLSGDTELLQVNATPDGTALSNSVAEVLVSGGPAHGDVVLASDHNGEERRARELGNACVRLYKRFPMLAAAAQWYPAASFGDTGAASGAVAACMISRAFARRHSGLSTAIVLLSSDGGRRGALRLDRYDHGS